MSLGGQINGREGNEGIHRVSEANWRVKRPAGGSGWPAKRRKTRTKREERELALTSVA